MRHAVHSARVTAVTDRRVPRGGRQTKEAQAPIKLSWRGYRMIRKHPGDDMLVEFTDEVRARVADIDEAVAEENGLSPLS
jgi:hypothetical protein